MHELGHALYLEHVDNPDAIMFRLNTGVSLMPTIDDINALRTHCGLAKACLLYTSPSPRDRTRSRMPSSA